jgi:hypothetical protein
VVPAYERESKAVRYWGEPQIPWQDLLMADRWRGGENPRIWSWDIPNRRVLAEFTPWPETPNFQVLDSPGQFDFLWRTS